jgi:uncharacterized protein (DUF2062 family)
MLRQTLKKLMPSPCVLQRQWFLRPFGPRIADPRLWALQRRAVTVAFGAGLAICFIPLPVHMLLAGLLAVFLRLNLPAIYTTIFLVNPLTAVPVYYGAYRVGALITGYHLTSFNLGSGLDSFASLATLGELWKPFLAGCLVCGVICGSFGWLGLELLWRWQVLKRRQRRLSLRTT